MHEAVRVHVFVDIAPHPLPHPLSLSLSFSFVLSRGLGEGKLLLLSRLCAPTYVGARVTRTSEANWDQAKADIHSVHDIASSACFRYSTEANRRPLSLSWPSLLTQQSTQPCTRTGRRMCICHHTRLDSPQPTKLSTAKLKAIPDCGFLKQRLTVSCTNSPLACGY